MKQRRVLFIAYNFPPHGGAGVQRSLKFVKYLPEFGWQPIVITTTADANPVQDTSLLSELPQFAQFAANCANCAETPIVRVPGFSILRFQARLKRYQFAANRANCDLGKLATLLNLVLQIPDTTRFWATAARKSIAQIIERQHPQAIYTTSGPYSAHLLGLWTKERYHLPWLADFRDPWSKNLLMPYLPGYRALNRRLERSVLAKADRVCCVSTPWLQDLQSNLGAQTEKFIVLPNGYDDEEIRPLTTPERGERFIISHIGSFYQNRRPTQFLQAVDQLVQSGQIPLKRLCVRFFGKNARDLIPATPPYEVYGYVPHKELELFRAETHAFLLILNTSPENNGNHSGKLFEYIASNRPVLGIVPPAGVAAELINAARTGITVESSVEDIAAGLLALYHRWRTDDGQNDCSKPCQDWNPNWDVITQYTRRRLTERLAALFDEITRDR